MLKTYTLFVVLTLIGICSTVVYGATIQTWVSTVWHDPQVWAQNGNAITPQQIAEDFNYLKNKVDTLEVYVASSTSSSTPAIQGCKLRYRVQTNIGTSPWVETPWGGTSGNYQSGTWASIPGSISSFKYQMGVLCEEGSSLQFAYRYRGNRGEYGNTYSADAYTVSSTPGVWVDSGWTTSDGKSCSMGGGDGGCGAYIHDISKTGSAVCSTQLQLRLSSTGANLASDELSTTYGSYDYDTGSDGCGSGSTGCGIRADIRCTSTITNTSVCPVGKKMNLCFTYANEAVGKRCTSIGDGGFQWSNSWPPTVSMECK